MRKIFVSPSILSADFARLEKECKSFEPNHLWPVPLLSVTKLSK